jgi:hypothetical protein
MKHDLQSIELPIRDDLRSILIGTTFTKRGLN